MLTQPGQIKVSDVPIHDFLYKASTVIDSRFAVGDKYETRSGGIFRYCKSGAAVGGLKRGVINANIIPGDTSGSGYEGSLASEAAVGDYVVTTSDTGSAANRPANYYVGGQFVAFIATHYFVANILKSSAGDGTSITLTLDASIPVLTATSVGVTAYPSIYGNIKNGSAQLANIEAFVCVPFCTNISAADTYFWGMTRGVTWVTPHGSTWPGSAADRRDVYFHQDGTIDPAHVAGIGSTNTSPQRAGYLLHAGQSGTYGDALIMLMLE